MSAEFSVRRQIRADPDRTWGLLTDWSAHGRWVPLTTVRVTSSGPAGVGQTFVGRTGWGPLAFDDTMRVTGWRPPSGRMPGECVLVKTGSVVRGGATITVTPTSPGSQVDWVEWLEFPGLSRIPGVDAVVARLAGVFFGRVVAAMAAELDSIDG